MQHETKIPLGALRLARRRSKSRTGPLAAIAIAVVLVAAAACDAGSNPTGPGGGGQDPIEVRGTVIHVDVARGDDRNEGSREAPYATIGGALEGTDGTITVYVAGGTYPEAVELRSNAHVYGGFDGGSWTRSGAATVVGAGSRAVRALTVGNVTLDGLTLVAADASGSAPNSVAVSVHSSFGVVVTNNVLRAGLGRPGNPGVDRSRPAKASNGGEGEDDAICGTNLNRGGSAGGGSSGRAGGVGGAGKSFLGFDGKDGKGALGGAGGDRGDADDDGYDGKRGGNGQNPGSDGAPGQALGDITGGLYVPPSGQAGGRGDDGSGGGGGGGGSGVSVVCGCAGGGGGQGGAGGEGGIGGGGGGGSFGVVVTANSEADIRGNRIETAGGAVGGRGGSGAPGGAGGSGGSGGSNLVAGYDGGDAGAGGTGARGGHAGGGTGGPSIGIASDGQASVTESGNVFDIGPAGDGGAGSADNSGPSGVRAETHGLS